MAHSSQHDTLCVDYCSISCGWIGEIHTNSESAFDTTCFFLTFLFFIKTASMMVIVFLPIIGFNEMSEQPGIQSIDQSINTLFRLVFSSFQID